MSRPMLARSAYRDWIPVRTTIAASVISIASWVATHPSDESRDASYPPHGSERQAEQQFWQESTTATAEADSRHLDALQQLLELQDGDRIREFLKYRPTLLGLIFETAIAAAPYFPDSRLVLESSVDPESDRVGLSLTVVTSGTPQAVLEWFDKFDADWWLSNMNRADGLLTVNAQYV